MDSIRKVKRRKWGRVACKRGYAVVGREGNRNGPMVQGDEREAPRSKVCAKTEMRGKKEKDSNVNREENGMWLTFLPVIDTDEFGDDVVDELKVHLLKLNVHLLKLSDNSCTDIYNLHCSI